ncbi:hypothetical protein ISF_03801 [Cordyceps fumosorosea ARSEF 2679]|uniref:Tubby n=1 Tax=Cordyceps fumosorosea (strain ARSEF 2679) TaxID=1081104 RepID=A0A167ZKI2_CORFA|nr:hypothetical protein ISF_03801 [Cordyceps fumosorosea ARSEF 2679]OAA67625.1 hypothetical protein ISF_03801 [Cordyceps fumosorosea ARSEF 2679]
MSTPRQFKIKHTSFSRHYTVLSPDEQPLYHADQSAFTHDKANLTLHAGSDTSGPIVAVAHLPRLSFDAKIGLGDPSSSSGDMAWEDLHRSSRDASAHEWSMTLPDGGRRRTFAWRRTHRVSADGMESSALTMRDLKLVEVTEGEGEEEVVAVFTGQRGWSSCGVLQINDERYGPAFDIMVTATMLAIYEKARRRRAREGQRGTDLIPR